MRVHLALFYFYGLYYHWSKRVTGKFAEAALNVWVYANCVKRRDIVSSKQYPEIGDWCRIYNVALHLAFRHNA